MGEIFEKKTLKLKRIELYFFPFRFRTRISFVYIFGRISIRKCIQRKLQDWTGKIKSESILGSIWSSVLVIYVFILNENLKGSKSFLFLGKRKISAALHNISNGNPFFKIWVKWRKYISLSCGLFFSYLPKWSILSYRLDNRIKSTERNENIALHSGPLDPF